MLTYSKNGLLKDDESFLNDNNPYTCFLNQAAELNGPVDNYDEAFK